ncbi:MAG: hypothetical protein E7505_06095 [Ruminococcus sp.]|nr:hypothetical protein [Ruminococcus sp.]
MTGYEKYEQLLRKISLINEELRECWSSESSELFCSSLDEAAEYIGKVIAGFRETLEKSGTKQNENKLSDFSFD